MNNFFSKKKNCLTLENFDFSTCGEKTLLPRFRVAIQAEPLISSLKDQRGDTQGFSMCALKHD